MEVPIRVLNEALQGALHEPLFWGAFQRYLHTYITRMDVYMHVYKQ